LSSDLIFIGLFGVDGKHYREISPPGYRRLSFGKISWLYQPGLFGITNANPIVFPKKVESDWGQIVAIGMFLLESGGGLVGILPISEFATTEGKAVIIPGETIFIPLNFGEVPEGTVKGVIVH
jgi:hypothetical protein